jgi:hypothetical protein
VFGLAADAADDMYSFSESKTEKLFLSSPSEWIIYNTKQLSRIYPAGKSVTFQFRSIRIVSGVRKLCD